MRLTKTKRRLMQGAVLAGAACAWLFAACTAVGPPRPTCADVSDAGAVDAVAITPYTTVTTDAQPPEVYGMEPDPGPQCLDCTQGRDFDFMHVADFENGFAPSWFNYGEPGVFLEPPAAGEGLDENGMPRGNGPTPPYWGLQVSPLAAGPGERCGSKYALHMAGGRFTSWGGGFVTRLFVVRGEYIDRFCSPESAETYTASLMGADPERNGIGSAPRYMAASGDGELVQRDQASGCFFYASPAADQPSLLGVDVSEFEGISFWARRGPSGQASLRVALVDDNVSEDLALNIEREAYLASDGEVKPGQAGATCTRVKGCCRHCSDLLPFDAWVPATDNRAEDIVTLMEKRCWLPGNRLLHLRRRISCDGTAMEQIVAWDFRDSECGDEPTTTDLCHGCWQPDREIYTTWSRDFGLCCPPPMEDEATYPQGELYSGLGDPRYGGKECSPYVFNYDHSSGYYCHTPGEILPEKNQNRCGEGFEASVIVDTEWKLIRVPWSELRRFTPDKPPFNPKSVWQIAFFFGQGHLDTYVDDVGFYRTRR